MAALAAAAFAPAAVMSQDKIDEKARASGMAEAPALAQQAGVTCQITDARLIGKSEDRRAKTSTAYYEVDCATGLGFVIVSVSNAAPTAADCLETAAPTADGKPTGLECKLPGNLDAKADFAAYVAKSGADCAITGIRNIGRTAENSYHEVACQSGKGYVMRSSYPADPAKDVAAISCLSIDANSNLACTLTSREAQLAVVDQLAAADAKGCTVSERRYIGRASDGADYFEAACADGKGFIYKVAANGALDTSYECAKALSILGGCTLTDAREAATEQAALYTRLATQAGFTCDVDSYAVFPARQGKDIVELVCKNGPGGVAIFEAGGKGTFLNCAHALIAGYRCGLNQDKGNAGLTADLRKLGRNSCEVSESRLIGKTAAGATYVETACSDGLPGYIVEFSGDPPNATAATGCALAKGIAGGCKLPANNKS